MGMNQKAGNGFAGAGAQVQGQLRPASMCQFHKYQPKIEKEKRVHNEMARLAAAPSDRCDL